MVDAVDLLHRCRAAGVRLAVNGDQLEVRGKKKVCASLIPELRAAKAELLAAVRIEAVDDYGHRAYRLVRAVDDRPMNLGLCVDTRWARALAAEHGLRVLDGEREEGLA